MSKRLSKVARSDGTHWLRPLRPGLRFALCVAVGFALAAGASHAMRAAGWAPQPAGSPQPAATQAAARPALKAASPAVWPASVEPLLKTAAGQLAAERLADAFRQYEKVLQAAPGHPQALYGMGEVYRLVDRAELAEKLFREALASDPEHFLAQLKLARVLCDVGKNEEALPFIQAVERKKPNDLPVIWLAARNYLRLGKAADAVRYMEKYTTASPRDALGLAWLGRAYDEAGNPAAAEKAYRQSLSVNPRTALACLWLGQLLVATNRRTEADVMLANFRRFRDLEEEIRHCERDLMRRPDDVMALVKLARARYLLGRGRQALVPLSKALELSPNDERLRQLYKDVESSLEAPTESEINVRSER